MGKGGTRANLRSQYKLSVFDARQYVTLFEMCIFNGNFELVLNKEPLVRDRHQQFFTTSFRTLHTYYKR